MDFLDSRPEGLYRIKGYVDFGPHDPRNRYAVHAVGRFLRFYPEPWAAARSGSPSSSSSAPASTRPPSRKELEACENDAPHADEHGMWGVLRYVQEPEERDRRRGRRDPTGQA